MTSQTHLFVSDAEQSELVLRKLQQELCENNDQSCFCKTCEKIKSGTHHSIIWLSPTGQSSQYKLEDLSIIFEKTRLALDHGKKFFFVIKQAHLLSHVCANKLLKTLEEPPPGYIFFLETNNEQSILPTIRSRCHIHHDKNRGKALHQTWEPAPRSLVGFNPFSLLKDPFLFDQELRKWIRSPESQRRTEQQSLEMAHSFSDSIKKKIIELQKNCTSHLEIERLESDKNFINLKKIDAKLQQALKKPPAAGSTSLFWKNLFLNLS